MRKAARAKEIIESAVPVPLDNVDDSAPLHEETFDIGPVSNPEDTPEDPEPTAPFVTNQVSLHDHQPQKIDGKTYNFSTSQIPNLDRHVATMTIPSQVFVPASLFSSLSSYDSFKMQAWPYSCKNLTLEMDLSNTLSAAVQLVPAPILVDYIRISTGSGAILKTLYGKVLWGYLAMTSNNVKMTGYQYITNTAPTTFQLALLQLGPRLLTISLCCYLS